MLVIFCRVVVRREISMDFSSDHATLSLHQSMISTLLYYYSALVTREVTIKITI